METRTVTQIKLYKLILNDMRSPKIELVTLAAICDDLYKLINWYQGQLERWKDGKWCKTFRQGSQLEWFNGCPTLEVNPNTFSGDGIRDEWVDCEVYETIRRTHPLFLRIY